MLTEVKDPLPLSIGKWKMNTSLEARLDRRPLSLRNLRERARFRIQEGIVRGFRDYLYGRGFTEIHTPKIGAKGAEGGATFSNSVISTIPRCWPRVLSFTNR